MEDEDAKIRLTEREKEVWWFLAQGMTAKEVALKLDLSYKTIEAHVYNVKTKFRCTNKISVIRKLILHGHITCREFIHGNNNPDSDNTERTDSP